MEIAHQQYTIRAAGPVRLVFLQPNPQPPPLDNCIDRFVWLSRKLEGDVLQPVWFCLPEQLDTVLGLQRVGVFCTDGAVSHKFAHDGRSYPSTETVVGVP